MKSETGKRRKKQQMDIEQMKTQLKNTGDQVGMLLQMLSNIQKQEVNAGTATTQAPKDFVLQKLGILTNGKMRVHLNYYLILSLSILIKDMLVVISRFMVHTSDM